MPIPRSSYLPTRADLRGVIRLASPIVLIQVGMIAMGVVDSIMVGWLSADALAAVALGNVYSFGLTSFGLGTLLALDPIIAQALGAGDQPAVARGLQRGLLLAVLLGIPTSLAFLAVEPLLALIQQPAEIIPIASGYVYRIMPGVFPFFVFVVLRQTLQAHRQTRDVLITIVLANAANVALNYVWIYGKLGFPALGALGSAWATLVCRWFMAAFLLALGWKYLARYLKRLADRVFDARAMLKMWRLGMPIGAQVFLEWAVFGTVAFLMGALGTVQVAAHQVAINLASVTFMVPVGISSAAAVIVGHAVGSGDLALVRRSSVAALLAGIGFMALMAAVFIGIPDLLAGIYTDHAAVLALAVLLLPIAGLFQVFDGAQAVSLGVLRGLGDTRAPMVIAILGFWLCGMPVSLWLAYGRDLGAVGLWWGLVAGLVAVATFLVLRIRHRLRREIVRVQIDEPLPP
jgi:multidrug resistance protein, MATE family